MEQRSPQPFTRDFTSAYQGISEGFLPKGRTAVYNLRLVHPVTLCFFVEHFKSRQSISIRVSTIDRVFLCFGNLIPGRCFKISSYSVRYECAGCYSFRIHDVYYKPGKRVNRASTGSLFSQSIGTQNYCLA